MKPRRRSSPIGLPKTSLGSNVSASQRSRLGQGGIWSQLMPGSLSDRCDEMWTADAFADELVRTVERLGEPPVEAMRK